MTYDTNVLIRYRPATLPAGFFMSAVVVQELVAGVNDAEEVEKFERLWRRYEREGRLLVPTGEDWWLAGKVLRALRRGARSHKSGRVPAISKEEQQRILRDVLIARTAKRVNAVVITENVADFRKIKHFCDVRIGTPDEFLR